MIQIDAHADLRDELDGEPYSHACAIARSLDEGALSVYQVGIRAYCHQEAELIESDNRIHTWFARDVMSPCSGEKAWSEWLESIANIDGPVHLTIDIDGLDGSLVPATGTPVPGDLPSGMLFKRLKQPLRIVKSLVRMSMKSFLKRELR